ncbi:MAG: glycerophosphodiester phosphodiesterase family protein [Rhodoluna sp.]|nr:glycerophosphodiester phosphodiesterase family protein [Rhodoluna sp.]
MKPYLSPAEFKILAHRGSTETGAVENTLEAFQAAIDSGITYLETDVQATSDGVAVLFHDETLRRISGLNQRVNELSFLQLSVLKHQGKALKIPKLVDALMRFPDAKFNLDLKTADAIAPTVAVIRELKAIDRVLVSSFDKGRRMVALQQIPGVATSPDAFLVLKIWLAARFGLRNRLSRLLLEVDVLQIPKNFGPIRFDRRKFIYAIHRSSVSVHFWTINDVSEAERLRAMGADGIVTDASKLMMSAFGNK